jgi:hypothetical protein
MRLSLMSAALCGVAFVPLIQSAIAPDSSSRPTIVDNNGNYDCPPENSPACSAQCLVDGQLRTENGVPLCQVVDASATPTSLNTGTSSTVILGSRPSAASDSSGNSDDSESQRSATTTTTPTSDATADANNLQTASNTSKKRGPNVGAIAGGVIGGVLFLALIAGFLFFFLRRRRSARAQADDVYDRSAIAVLDKSRASSPTSHAVEPPVYAGAVPPQQAQQPAAAAPVPAPRQPTPEPVELHSREVDDDGVSVSSFDMQRPEERAVPRLPVYHRSTPPGGSAAAL